MQLLRHSLLVMGIALLATLPHAGASCGISWSVPKNYFDSINDRGEFSYWRAIGQIDLGNDFKIPLIIGFKPNRGGFSCLGRGWIVPLLESNVVQIDESRFLLTQPDGGTRKFWRKNPTDSILLGHGSWKGGITDNTIFMWSECGTRLEFFKGKIVRIVTLRNQKERILSIHYLNGKASEVQENGKIALKIERDSNGTPTSFKFGENQVKIEFGERPRIEVTEENNLVTGMEQSVHTLTLADGK